MPIKSEIANLCKQNGYKGISAEIRLVSNGKDHDKNRLVAILCLNPGNGGMKDLEFVEGNDLIKNAFTSLEKEVASYSCKGKWGDKYVQNGQVLEIFFLAKGWPKLKKKLDELGIKYELDDRLDPKEIDPDKDINDYLLPSSQKIFGFKPEK